MPTNDLPGIGASILMGWAAKAKAKLLDKVVILESFTPSAGLKANWVTAGPTLTSAISTGIPKFSNVFLMMMEFSFMLPDVGTVSFLLSKSMGGNEYFPLLTAANVAAIAGFFSCKGFPFLNIEMLGACLLSSGFSSMPFILKVGESELFIGTKDVFFSSFSLNKSSQTNCRNINSPINSTAPKTILATKRPSDPATSLPSKNPTHPPFILSKLYDPKIPAILITEMEIASIIAKFLPLFRVFKNKNPPNIKRMGRK